jgi:hypothetical protein
MKLLRTLLTIVLLISAALAQEAPKPVVSPKARMMNARTIFITHSGGSIPNDIIDEAFRGWGRYRVVNRREDADMIVSIEGVLANSGIEVSGGGPNGTRREVVVSGAVTNIRLFIRDAHDGAVLWAGHEQPKNTHKGDSREDREVEASLRLFRSFRGYIEPEPAP